MHAPTIATSEIRSRLAEEALRLRSTSAEAFARAHRLGAGLGGPASPFEAALAARLPAAREPLEPAAARAPGAAPVELGDADPGPYWEAPLGAPSPRVSVLVAPRSALAPATPAAPRAESGGAERAADAEAVAPARGEERYVVQKGDTLWRLSLERFHTGVEALARANGIDDPRRLQVGQVLVVPRPLEAGPQWVVASWYGPGFDGKPMANGHPYDRHAATIAHKTLPLGTQVELTNPRTGVSVRAVVTDRGPYVDGRDVDLSYGLADRLDVVRPGVDELVLRVRS